MLKFQNRIRHKAVSALLCCATALAVFMSTQPARAEYSCYWEWNPDYDPEYPDTGDRYLWICEEQIEEPPPTNSAKFCCRGLEETKAGRTRLKECRKATAQGCSILEDYEVSCTDYYFDTSNGDLLCR